ncbi:uncharacterized protein LOC142231978 isoform X2 [Haematobia irritans]|uniref:uncharacterized protein LOC142231978 isoform X2 n=1 Tax=Haematobia irritans TaxID=7368 RepID=UPI003F4FF08A
MRWITLTGLLLLLHIPYMQAVFEGDPCKTKGTLGVCKPWDGCPVMETLIKSHEYNIQEVVRCGFDVWKELICCPSSKPEMKANGTTSSSVGDTTSNYEFGLSILEIFMEPNTNTTDTIPKPDFWWNLSSPSVTTTTMKTLNYEAKELNESSKFFDSLEHGIEEDDIESRCRKKVAKVKFPNDGKEIHNETNLGKPKNDPTNLNLPQKQQQQTPEQSLLSNQSVESLSTETNNATEDEQLDLLIQSIFNTQFEFQNQYPKIEEEQSESFNESEKYVNSSSPKTNEADMEEASTTTTKSSNLDSEGLNGSSKTKDEISQANHSSESLAEEVTNSTSGDTLDVLIQSVFNTQNQSNQYPILENESNGNVENSSGSISSLGRDIQNVFNISNQYPILEKGPNGDDQNFSVSIPTEVVSSAEGDNVDLLIQSVFNTQYEQTGNEQNSSGLNEVTNSTGGDKLDLLIQSQNQYAENGNELNSSGSVPNEVTNSTGGNKLDLLIQSQNQYEQNGNEQTTSGSNEVTNSTGGDKLNLFIQSQNQYGNELNSSGSVPNEVTNSTGGNKLDLLIQSVFNTQFEYQNQYSTVEEEKNGIFNGSEEHAKYADTLSSNSITNEADKDNFSMDSLNTSITTTIKPFIFSPEDPNENSIFHDFPDHLNHHFNVSSLDNEGNRTNNQSILEGQNIQGEVLNLEKPSNASKNLNFPQQHNLNNETLQTNHSFGSSFMGVSNFNETLKPHGTKHSEGNKVDLLIQSLFNTYFDFKNQHPLNEQNGNISDSEQLYGEYGISQTNVTKYANATEADNVASFGQASLSTKPNETSFLPVDPSTHEVKHSESHENGIALPGPLSLLGSLHKHVKKLDHGPSIFTQASTVNNSSSHHPNSFDSIQKIYKNIKNFGMDIVKTEIGKMEHALGSLPIDLEKSYQPRVIRAHQSNPQFDKEPEPMADYPEDPLNFVIEKTKALLHSQPQQTRTDGKSSSKYRGAAQINQPTKNQNRSPSNLISQHRPIPLQANGVDQIPSNQRRTIYNPPISEYSNTSQLFYTQSKLLQSLEPYEFLPSPEEGLADRSAENYSSTPSKRRPNISIDRPAVRACRRFERGLNASVVHHILGGVPAELGEFPHMVGIGYSRIAGNGQAAHCVDSNDRIPSIVRMGVVNFNDPDEMLEAVQIGIKQYFIHDDYKSGRTYNDIAILELKRPAPLSKFIYPACLYTDEADPKRNVRLTVTGWGSVNVNTRKFSNILLKAHLHVTPLEECNSSYVAYGLSRAVMKGIIKTQLCAKDDKDLKDSCHGDSGGPLNLLVDESRNNYRVVGIVNSGISCASPIPGLYTRVAAFLDFVEKIVWPNGGD